MEFNNPLTVCCKVTALAPRRGADAWHQQVVARDFSQHRVFLLCHCHPFVGSWRCLGMPAPVFCKACTVTTNSLALAHKLRGAQVSACQHMRRRMASRSPFQALTELGKFCPSLDSQGRKTNQTLDRQRVTILCASRPSRAVRHSAQFIYSFIFNLQGTAKEAASALFRDKLDKDRAQLRPPSHNLTTSCYLRTHERVQRR